MKDEVKREEIVEIAQVNVITTLDKADPIPPSEDINILVQQALLKLLQLPSNLGSRPPFLIETVALSIKEGNEIKSVETTVRSSDSSQLLGDSSKDMLISSNRNLGTNLKDSLKLHSINENKMRFSGITYMGRMQDAEIYHQRKEGEGAHPENRHREIRIDKDTQGERRNQISYDHPGEEVQWRPPHFIDDPSVPLSFLLPGGENSYSLTRARILSLLNEIPHLSLINIRRY